MTTTAWQRLDQPRPAPQSVLVIGSTGMVGRAWCELLTLRAIEFTSVHRPEFDLSKPESIDHCIRDRFDLVVNAAAWTDVDGAEADEPGATQANAHAVKHIAQRCHEVGATLITYSTDYVFGGNASEPYPIDAPINPVNAYGRSKAVGEQLLRDTTDNHLLIRTSWVHAPWGKNFVLTMKMLMEQRDLLRVVDDQQGRPSSAISIATGSLDLYLAGGAGTWHLTDNDECTWFEFAEKIRDLIGSNCGIEPCSSDEFPRPADRPSYSTLDIESTRQALGSIPSWQEMLEHTLNHS
jgi:dTDP-4-dehydrorhamnose reductase